jgi:diguanylate cyclase (GGDEF)-like protein
LRSLGFVQQGFLILALGIAVTILAAWAMPSFGRLLPHGWDRMRPNTAFAIGCAALSLILSLPGRSPLSLLFSRILAALVFVLALVVYGEYFLPHALPVDSFLDLSPAAHDPGRMSPRTAITLLMLAPVLYFMIARRSISAYLADLAVLALFFNALTILSGYLFGVRTIFGIALEGHSSPHTTLAICLLGFVAVSRRAEYGFHSVLLGPGIAGKTSRIILPTAIVLPLLLLIVRGLVVSFRLVEPPYANAITTATASVLFIVFVLLLAWRIDALETRIHDLSLRDELTGLYNRRGFYILSEQSLHLARRFNTPFSILYLDLDRLKQINDAFGHDVGSECLQVAAGILLNSFRQIDIIGRIGGDEFVVACEASAEAMTQGILRLEQAIEIVNGLHRYPYTISFSFGTVTGEQNNESLEQILRRADKIMYEQKRRKRDR